MRLSFGGFSVGNGEGVRINAGAIFGRWNGIGVAVAGVAIVIGSFFVRSIGQIDGSWKQTTAKITSVRSTDRQDCDEDADGNQTCRTRTYYTPTLAYTVNSKTVTSDGSESTDEPGVGGEVKIAYEPGNETNMKEVDDSNLAVALSWLMTVLGIATVIAGIWQVVSGKKANRHSISQPILNQLDNKGDNNNVVNNSQFPHSN